MLRFHNVEIKWQTSGCAAFEFNVGTQVGMGPVVTMVGIHVESSVALA